MPEKESIGKVKLLIVEDDYSTMRLYDRSFPEELFEKKLVTTGNTALEAYKTWAPDICILDIMLPGFSGYHVLETLHDEGFEINTTTIIATALGRQNSVIDYLRFGATAYIVKPFDRHKIVTQILEYYKKENQGKAEAMIANYQRLMDTKAKAG